MLTIDQLELPTSPALDRFLNIAFDGVGTIDSAWDTCVVGCDIDVLANRICGGTPGKLADFKWKTTEPDSPTNPAMTSSQTMAGASLTLLSSLLATLYLLSSRF